MLSALLLCVSCRFFQAALAIGALWMLAFVVHAALAIGALRVLVVTSLCLFACCSCHRGFANACGEMSVFICMLLLPSGLCRCLNFVVHATLAIGALQVLVIKSLCLFARCSCHRGFAGASGEKFVFICTLLLPSGLCRCL